MKSTYKIALSVALLSVAAGAVYATTTTVDIAATLRVGLTFANVVNMDFTPGGIHIDFNGTPATGTDFVDLGSDSQRTVEGTVFQLTPTGNGTAGSLTIDGDGASAVDISCSATATMASASVSTTVITVDNLQIKPGGTAGATYATATGGGVTMCAGVGTTPASYTLNGATDNVFIGGRLDGDNTVTTAAYSTANSGGTPMTVEVVYQ